MEIIIIEKDYNGKKYIAELTDYTNNWYANYSFTITGGGDTKEEARENIINKAKEMIEDINNVIYK